MVTIIGVRLTDRDKNAVEFQQILTKFGCSIRTRIGLHPSERDICLNRGIILLETAADEPLLLNELSERWEVKTMTFD